MNTLSSSFQQNMTAEKKTADAIQKDVRKWVDSVVEFKAGLEKKKSDPPLEKHLKKIKKFKVKRKPSFGTLTAVSKNLTKGASKTRKITRTDSPAEKLPNKLSTSSADKYDIIKESYRTLKLPPNWTSGVTSGRIVFNRIKVTTQNSQQKMAVEKSLIITKDCNLHVLMNGSEILLKNWEMQKVDTIEDVKKAIKDIDTLKICEDACSGSTHPQCFILLEGQNKTYPLGKSEIKQKSEHKQSIPKKKPAQSKQKKLKKQKSHPK